MTNVPYGDIDSTKKRLLALIEEADPAINAFGDWRLAMESLYGPVTGLKLPAVTVRVNPAAVRDMVYGRRIPESGNMATYGFSAHVFCSACTASGEEAYKYAHEISDKIMTHLATRIWDESPHTSYEIVDIFDMSARESEPAKGGRQICRVIIEGTMLVKRRDA